MAVFNSFTFDGINSLDSGVYITGQAVFNAPERVVEMVTVPGRNGALALDQGRFENIEVTYHAGCFADSQADFADKVMRFRNALASRYTYKRLTDEYHPDEYRLGLYKSGLDVDAVRYGTAGEFNIVFDCKPQRFLIDGDRAISPTEWSDVQTESGELVTIDSDGSLAVKSLEVSLEPIQDLNGYDKPWVGGAGKNKIPFPYADNRTEIAGVPVTTHDDGTITFNGTPSGGTMFFNLTTESANPITLEAGTYTLSNGGIIGNLCRITAVKDGSYFTTTDSSSGKTTFTIKEQGVFSFYISTPNGTAMNNITVKPMLEEGSTATSYAPYSNICPISGRTEVVTQRTGKNLLPMPITSGSYANTVTVTVNDDKSFYISKTSASGWTVFNLATGLLLKAGTYTLIESDDSSQNASISVINSATQTEITNTRYTKRKTITLGADTIVNIKFARSSVANNILTKLMLFAGSTATATDYEPYQGTTYTTALGRTVYGGTLDVVSGELTVDRAYRTFNGSENWETVNRGLRLAGRFGGKAYSTKNVSNMLTYATSDPTLNPNSYKFTVGGFANVGVPYTVAEWKSLLATTNLQVVYELATPQTYQLTPQQIDLLLGTNHLWSDGSITVTYGTHPLYNPTQFESRPLLVVTGKGILQIGDYVLTIVGRENQTIYIDCESQEAWEVVGAGKISRNDYIRNAGEEFPVLVPGINNISLGSGITAVTITPRWWRI